ncbi:MAG: potassium transporter TrkG [Candidatus Eisenbacteria bacterium]
MSGLVAILLTQRLNPTVAAFEVVSALATVGLTIGGTAELDGIGKIVIMVAMFIGRSRIAHAPHVSQPESRRPFAWPAGRGRRGRLDERGRKSGARPGSRRDRRV